MSAPLEDTDPMPFGKPMQDVPARYLHWMRTEAGRENDRTCPVGDYIRRNLNTLKKEYSNGIW